MTKAAADVEGFEILDKRTIRKGKRRLILFETTEGDMVPEALAVRLELTLPGLNTRIGTYGLLDPRVVHGPDYFKKKRPSWEGFSDKPRSSAKLERMTMSDFLNSAPEGRRYR